MTKKPNKSNKPKLFEDYSYEYDLALDQEVLWNRDMNSMEEKLNNLATQIHELNEKMDFVMENTMVKQLGEVYSLEGSLKDFYEKSTPPDESK